MGVEEFKLIDEFLAEGKEYLRKDDPIQASEKFYKATEECIKLLAEGEKLPEYEEAEREGRWWSRLLSRAARALSSKLGEEKIEDVWARAFDLHVWGFHEKALDVEHIKPDVSYIEWLVTYTKRTTKRG